LEQNNLVKQVITLPNKVKELIDDFQFHNALSEMWKIIAIANKHINDTEPWKIEDKGELGNVLYNLLETLRYIAILLSPFMPETSEKIMEQLCLDQRYSYEDLTWGVLQHTDKIRRGKILFKKILLDN
jgi:methionyl-tRNA synthetase